MLVFFIFASVCNASTEMPNTFASALLYHAILSLTEQSSFVQVLVKASGKKKQKDIMPFLFRQGNLFFFTVE
jgi:hypothetical protein